MGARSCLFDHRVQEGYAALGCNVGLLSRSMKPSAESVVGKPSVRPADTRSKSANAAFVSVLRVTSLRVAAQISGSRSKRPMPTSVAFGVACHRPAALNAEVCSGALSRG